MAVQQAALGSLPEGQDSARAPVPAAVILADGVRREIWPGLLDLLSLESGQPLARCYQCHRCSSGCPAIEFMDLPPDQLIRMAQLGLATELLAAGSIWSCLSCHTCGLRCPNGIDVGRVMDVLKGWHLAATEPAAVSAARGGGKLPPPAERRAALFHRLFIGGVGRLGRMHELTLMGLYKLLSGDLFADLAVGMRMIFRGKMPLVPKLRPERRDVAEMFERAKIVSRRRAGRTKPARPPAGGGERR